MADTNDYWFVPKTHGYGAYPANWKGWAAILAYVAVVTAISLPLMVWPAIQQSGPLVASLITWLVLLFVVTVGFIQVCRAKTDGEWSWRWGNKT